MKMKNGWRRLLVRTIAVLLVLEVYAATASRFDARTVAAGKVPVLSFAIVRYLDGGTTVYWGLGYVIVEPRSIAGVQDEAGKIVIGYATEKTAGVKYWIPIWPMLRNREASAVYEERESNKSVQTIRASSADPLV